MEVNQPTRARTAARTPDRRGRGAVRVLRVIVCPGERLDRSELRPTAAGQVGGACSYQSGVSHSSLPTRHRRTKLGQEGRRSVSFWICQVRRGAPSRLTCFIRCSLRRRQRSRRRPGPPPLPRDPLPRQHVGHSAECSPWLTMQAQLDHPRCTVVSRGTCDLGQDLNAHGRRGPPWVRLFHVKQRWHGAH